MSDCAGKPIVDEAALERLREALGGDFAELIGECLVDVDAACARMAAAARRSDGAGVKRAAHTLAGVLGQFGCPRAACMSLAMAGFSESDALAAAAATLDAARAAGAELAARAVRG